MKYTQFLVFEICRDCNLADQHQKCPSGTPDRYGDLDTTTPMTDAEIVECAGQAYKSLGFRGNIAWHYYNEPMLAWDRILRLMPAIREQTKRAKFTLWTNGTLLSPETPGLDQLDQIWISNYQNRDWTWLREIVPRVTVLGPHLDNRREPLATPNNNRCLRPYNELVIDHYGNGHLCCMDWRGSCILGNVRGDGFDVVVDQFTIVREAVAQQPMMHDCAPAACLRCIGHQAHIGDLVPTVQALTQKDKPWEITTQSNPESA